MSVLLICDVNEVCTKAEYVRFTCCPSGNAEYEPNYEGEKLHKAQITSGSFPYLLIFSFCLYMCEYLLPSVFAVCVSKWLALDALMASGRQRVNRGFQKSSLCS